MPSSFQNMEQAPPIEMSKLNTLCREDPHTNKVNMTPGGIMTKQKQPKPKLQAMSVKIDLPPYRGLIRADTLYRTEEGKPWVFPVVREAEKKLAADTSQNHEYLPVMGFEPFCREATKLALGENSVHIKNGTAIAVQCLSGTGCIRVGAEFLARVCGRTVVYLSRPTWENHKRIFKNSGFTDIREHIYWDQANRCIDFKGMMDDLEKAPEMAIVVFHGCAHNPTGVDPTQEQWKQILKLMQRKKLFPFIDFAYQGFASGDVDRDAFAVRLFADSGMEFLICQSFAKNFGLYNERIGNLILVVNDPRVVAAVKSQITLLVRANWSNPPNHGAKVVHMILTDSAMKKEWYDCINVISERIKLMRKMLKDNLDLLGTPGSWNHFVDQIGMFSYTGLSESQCAMLASKHHIYLLRSGRVNMCSLNTKNVGYVANAIDDIIRIA